MGYETASAALRPEALIFVACVTGLENGVTIRAECVAFYVACVSVFDCEGFVNGDVVPENRDARQVNGAGRNVDRDRRSEELPDGSMKRAARFEDGDARYESRAARFVIETARKEARQVVSVGHDARFEDRTRGSAIEALL